MSEIHQWLHTQPDMQIIAATPHAEMVVEQAARTCYNSEKLAGSKSGFIQGLIKRGHESVLEHASLTVKFSNVSRSFSHQLVRHRLAAYSQLSMRYVDQGSCSFVFPDHCDMNTEVTFLGRQTTVSDVVQELESLYSQLRGRGWKKEDARLVLPIATSTSIVMTANFREWRHVFKLRCDKHAQLEIRIAMLNVLAYCVRHWPDCFEDLSHYMDDWEPSFELN